MFVVPESLKRLDNRIAAAYNKAIDEALVRYRDLFATLKKIDDGTIKPPEGVNFDKWRQEFVNKLIHESGVIDHLSKVLAEAGVAVNSDIREVLDGEFVNGYKFALGAIGTEAERAGVVTGSFSLIEGRQVDILARRGNGSPFTKIAFERSEDAEKISGELSDALLDVVLHGGGQREMVEAIQRVTGFEASRCKRIAQTEYTRIQSEAGYTAALDAAASGVGVYHEWSCQFLPPNDKGFGGSRETHMAIHGQKRAVGMLFDLPDGDKLRYPGDRMGRACNTINCRCSLIPHVLLPGEYISPSGEVVKRGR